MQPHATQRGFTLVEALIVTIVAAVLAAVAVPSLTGALAAQRVRAAGSDLTTALLLARSEAVKRNALVQVAPQSNNDWTTGWRVTIVNGGGQIDTRGALGDRVQVGRAPTNVVYGGSGRTIATGMIRIELTDPMSTVNDQVGRCISIDTSGYPKLARGGCG
jgi:type IV fimbrial biogenesis protein FimT